VKATFYYLVLNWTFRMATIKSHLLSPFYLFCKFSLDFHICRYCVHDNKFGYMIFLSLSLSVLFHTLSGAQVIFVPNLISAPCPLLRGQQVWGAWVTACLFWDLVTLSNCVYMGMWNRVELCVWASLWNPYSISPSAAVKVSGFISGKYIIVFLEWPKATPWTHSPLPLYSHLKLKFFSFMLKHYITSCANLM